jgi:hypothetical protein
LDTTERSTWTPFAVIPFKGRPVKATAPDDRSKNHVRALPEGKAMEMRSPVVKGYAFALRKNLIRCDVDGMPALDIEPNRDPGGHGGVIPQYRTLFPAAKVSADACAGLRQPEVRPDPARRHIYSQGVFRPGGLPGSDQRNGANLNEVASGHGRFTHAILACLVYLVAEDFAM